MRRVLAVMVATLLAGCTSFPGTTTLLAEFEVGDLGPGEAAVHNFTLQDAWDFLFAGFRTGPGEHVHVVLRTPGGVRFDTAAAQPAGGCAVTRPAQGPWGLEVSADALDGRLEGGKFTVRGARGEVPQVLPCSDDVFPGRGRNLTLAWWNATLLPGENATLAFEQPFDLDRMEVAAREAPANATAEPGANATLNASAEPKANLTFVLVPPSGDSHVATGPLFLPPRGSWSLRVEAPQGRDAFQGTLFIRGWG